MPAAAPTAPTAPSSASTPVAPAWLASTRLYRAHPDLVDGLVGAGWVAERAGRHRDSLCALSSPQVGGRRLALSLTVNPERGWRSLDLVGGPVDGEGLWTTDMWQATLSGTTPAAVLCAIIAAALAE